MLPPDDGNWWIRHIPHGIGVLIMTAIGGWVKKAFKGPTRAEVKKDIEILRNETKERIDDLDRKVNERLTVSENTQTQRHQVNTGTLGRIESRVDDLFSLVANRKM